MSFARISTDFGIVVREGSLAQRNVSLSQLLQMFEVDAPFDRAGGLISFGPHFGRDASDALCRRLEAAGLRYIDDYFVFVPEAPDWCAFGATAIE
jgi:hypothetical protein